MKGIICFLFVITVIISFAGCSGNGSAPSNPQKNDTEQVSENKELSNEKLAEIVAKRLKVPDKESITYNVSGSYYWDSADCYYKNVTFTENGETVAYAAVDPNNGELLRNISEYSHIDKAVFTEGNLLYDLGAKSLDNIEKIEFIYEEYQGDYEIMPTITEKEDIERFLNYKYSSNYPGDKLHELVVYPNNNVYITINSVRHRLCLGDDGSLTTVFGNTITYKADDGKGITASVWEEMIEKYK